MYSCYQVKQHCRFSWEVFYYKNDSDLGLSHISLCDNLFKKNRELKVKLTLTINIFKSALSAGFLMRLDTKKIKIIHQVSKHVIQCYVTITCHATWRLTCVSEERRAICWVLKMSYHLVTKSWKSGVNTPWGSLGGGWKLKENVVV